MSESLPTQARAGRRTRLGASGMRRIFLDFGVGLVVFTAFAGLFAIDRWQTLGSTGFSFWCDSALAQDFKVPPVAVETSGVGGAETGLRPSSDALGPDALRQGAALSVTEDNSVQGAGAGDISAEPEGPPAEKGKISSRPLLADMTPPTALVLLGFMFAALFAFNLAFFRHYRRKVSWQDGNRRIVGRSVLVRRSQRMSH